ncbi:MAG: hypothetical protein K0S07_48 [Chlamydiales bacterium]|jgi:hypothetical protein|nr:hypothetical protein [Chlamydiales bacterium]
MAAPHSSSFFPGGGYPIPQPSPPLLAPSPAPVQGALVSCIAQQALSTSASEECKAENAKEAPRKKARLEKSLATSPLDWLADEVVNCIFDFLDPDSLKSMAQTCRRWHLHMQSKPLRPVLTLHQGCAPFNPEEFGAFLGRLASFDDSFGIDFKGCREQLILLLQHPAMSRVNYLKINLPDIENHREVQRAEQDLLQVERAGKRALSDLDSLPYQAALEETLQQVGILRTEMRKNGVNVNKAQKHLSLLAQREEEMNMLKEQLGQTQDATVYETLSLRIKNCQGAIKYHTKKAKVLEKGLENPSLFQQRYAKVGAFFTAMPVFAALKVLDVRCRVLEHLRILEQLIRNAPYLEAFRVPTPEKMKDPGFNDDEDESIYTPLFQPCAESLTYLNLSVPQNQSSLSGKWCSILGGASNLRHLVLGRGADEEELTSIHQIYRQNPLEILSLHDSVGEPCTLGLSEGEQEPLCPNLKRLQLFYPNVDLGRMENILGHCPNLKSLAIITRLPNPSPDGLTRFKEALQSMSELLKERGVVLEWYLYVSIRKITKFEALRSLCPDLVFDPLEIEQAEKLIHQPYQLPTDSKVQMKVLNSRCPTHKKKIIKVSL